MPRPMSRRRHVAVVEGEVKAGVAYGVETDAVALKQVDAPDDLGAGDMFPLGEFWAQLVSQIASRSGVRKTVKPSLLFI